MNNASAFPPLAEVPSDGLWGAVAAPLHTAFKVFNRWFMVPAHHAGLGAWVSTPVGGWILLLRVRGRKSGVVRETPLNYVVESGSVWVMAGFGRTSEWYRNLIADPGVEVRLPGRRFACTAEEVLDPAVRSRMIPRLVRATGLPGTMVVPLPWTTPDEEILDAVPWVPLVRIRARDGTPIEAGHDDPGGDAWVWRQALAVAATFIAWRLVKRLVRH